MFPAIVKSMLSKMISQTHHRYPHKSGSKSQQNSRFMLCEGYHKASIELAKGKNVFTTHITDKRLIGIPTNQQVKRDEELNQQRPMHATEKNIRTSNML